MTILLIASSIDPASKNIKDSLLDQSSWKERDTCYGNPAYEHATIQDVVLVTINDDKIFHNDIDKEVAIELNIKPSHVIFISRHTSKTGRPTLTTHPIGNYTTAEFGGNPNTLVWSSPYLMAQLLRFMKRNLRQTHLEYNICYEVTHHGPYLSTPTIFVEIGSTEHEWSQPAPGRIIAKSLLELLTMNQNEDISSHEIPVLIGVGGGHYAPRFTDVVFERNIAFGHMIPSYHLGSESNDYKRFEQALARTPDIHGVYIHRKALKKSQISAYREWFQNHDIPIVSSKDLPHLDK